MRSTNLVAAALVTGFCLIAAGCSRTGSSSATAPASASPRADYLVNAVGQANTDQAAEVELRPEPEFNTEGYDRIYDNPFLSVAQNPLSTFSIDVDTASYANVRRFLQSGKLPPRDAVRIEELINYFTYDYTPPDTCVPFSVHIDVADCPWSSGHQLARVSLKGREISSDQRPPSNLVFLIDVSGSMQPANKLPLLKTALRMLVNQLSEGDRVAIVVYSGAAGLALPSTSCESRETILAALERLEAGGSTNGGAGIQLAYQVAADNFIRGGTNRVILATDGDFNVGVTNRGDLTRLVEDRAKTGIFLSVLGFGMGNLKDSQIEQLADKGDGNYAYIDSLDEARKVLVDQLGGTLITIARDVKIQIEFNPRTVGAYRLIGYENRLLRSEDFNDDRKDAGEIGAGHTVTALYELVPSGQVANIPQVDPLKYQKPATPNDSAANGGNAELMTVKLRYKEPNSNTSQLIERAVANSDRRLADAPADFQFVAAVAAFGMILRDSEHKGTATMDRVLSWAEAGRGQDREGYRSDFVKLVKLAQSLRPNEHARR
jgi:Ca-activated chloride channel family protein